MTITWDATFLIHLLSRKITRFTTFRVNTAANGGLLAAVFLLVAVFKTQNNSLVNP